MSLLYGLTGEVKFSGLAEATVGLEAEPAMILAVLFVILGFAFKGHPRCKTDEAIKAMAATGGVMGVTGVRNFVRNDEPTTIEHYVDHIDHIAGLVGIEHAGIGTDSDLKGYDALPPDVLQALKAAYSSAYGFRERIDIEGLDHPKKMYDITEALIRRGYTDSDIRGVLGENFRRALGEIWDA
jgi:membrane dipeptidase